MRRVIQAVSFALILAGLTLGASYASAEDDEQVKVVFEHALPNVQNKRVLAVLVTYPPGGKSVAHRHAPSAFVYAYVVSGAIRSQVGEQPVKIYTAGESFYEVPGSSHRISENASDKDPAALLAVFIVDSNDVPLTMPDQK